MFDPNSSHTKNVIQKVSRKLKTDTYRPFDKKTISPLIICMVPRSGSQYLCSLINKNGAKRVRESFRITKNDLENNIELFNAKSLDDYMRGLINTFSVDGFFGVKAMWLQFAPFYYLGAYDNFLSHGKFIYLTRKNILMQAISQYIASVTGYNHTSEKNNLNRLKKIDFSYDAIQENIESSIEMQEAWERFFSTENIDPLRIFYETLKETPKQVLIDVFNYIDIKLPHNPVTETNIKVVGNELNKHFAELFEEESNKRKLGRVII